MIFGYGRVSTSDQNPNLQLDALRSVGCEQIFIEKRTGRNMDRPELNKMLGQLRSGDVVVTWKMSRLGRSMSDMVKLANHFREMGVEYRCIALHLDTSTPTGRFFQNIMMAFDEFERENMVENTKAGLDAARARGRNGGRPKGLSDEYVKIAKQVKRAHHDGDSIRDIMRAFKIPSSATVYKILNYDPTPLTV